MSPLKFRLLVTGLLCAGAGAALILTPFFTDDKHQKDLVVIGVNFLVIGTILLGILYLIYFIQRRRT